MRSALSATALFLLSASVLAWAEPLNGRTVISLDGTWEVADSTAASPAPAAFGHRAPVPGLTHSATPPFADVDRFDSRELIDVEIRDKVRPESDRTASVGVPHQNRSYFWYRRTFRAPAARQSAILHVNKAQFGTAVWINGKSVGEHLGCFSAGLFNITSALNWDAENEIVIRIGAHPGALPPSVPAGTDKEKYRWTPGIYDSMFIALADNPVIESVQVAPRIASSEIVVRVVIRNLASTPVTFSLRQVVRSSKSSRTALATAAARSIHIAAGARETAETTIRIPNARLWTPEAPNLYELETSTGGDSVITRFGMREFRFDTATKRAYLNGKLIFLRGSNIALHRFFEDPESRGLPWDREWVRKLLADIPKKMHWNSFRFTLGPAPQFWYDIADEAGLLIQNEFPIWQGHWSEWSTDELVTEFSEWMRDHWNHPSLAIWDASNETYADVLREKVIPVVRKLDLSDRPWDNGYALPEGPNDMVEDHPYFFIQWQRPTWKRPGRDLFQITDLESVVGSKTDWNAPHPTAHAFVINEYGWLWLNRDGSPTILTDKVYERLLGPGSTAEQRFEAYAYYVAGLTEMWRAHREAAGVQHFVYLSCSYPGVKTSDNFRNVAALELEPHFADYVRESFKPLGVYLNFWQPSLKPAQARAYSVMMINDDPEPRRGTLTLTFERGGEVVKKVETAFDLPAYGQLTYPLRLDAPSEPGDYVLKAVASHAGGRIEATVSRRKVRIQ